MKKTEWVAVLHGDNGVVKIAYRNTAALALGLKEQTSEGWVATSVYERERQTYQDDYAALAQYVDNGTCRDDVTKITATQAARNAGYESLTHETLCAWAAKAVVGEYLALFADEPDATDPTATDSRCGYSDEKIDFVCRYLATRDLWLGADDKGLVVEVDGRNL